MSSPLNLILKSETSRILYLLVFAIILVVIRVIFSAFYHDAVFFPNLPLIALIYFSFYMELFAGAVASYALFYIYGSLTTLNPAAFALAGVIAFAVSFYFWKQFMADNIIYELITTLISVMVYYITVFFIAFYFFKFRYNFLHFLLIYMLPVCITTALASPFIFYLFKKIDSVFGSGKRTGKITA